ncbi:hypothetical protein ElyMa_002377000 [Elysia marginata]|uniref:Uncharacterized protein n=1 Tax=Elysia marginata TaxID=1093978 RepID=A0AAV4GCB5_9GAST|nr:hypothetical protein ElyMa_002377000 [Elysia marginata]
MVVTSNKKRQPVYTKNQTEARRPGADVFDRAGSIDAVRRVKGERICDGSSINGTQHAAHGTRAESNQTQPLRAAHSIVGTTQPRRSVACCALLYCSFVVPCAAKMDDYKKEIIEPVRDRPLL